jgi:SAM-dependent methyltransferase
MAALYHFPADLEQIIRAHAGADDESLRSLAEAITHLSDLFNGKMPWDPSYSRDPLLRRAYLGYFLPVNLPKIRTPLAAWVGDRRGLWAGRTLRCLDLGSGPGTALLGLCDFVRELPAEERPAALDLVATDHSPENLRDGRALLERLRELDPRVPPLRVRPLRLDLVADRSGLFPLATTDGRFDLVIAANVICELIREPGNGLDRARDLIAAVAGEVLDREGAILLMEPGLRETSRDFHRLRDQLLADGGLHVHAPCLHEESCPALATERDWCYADVAWEPPPLVAALDRLTGLRKGSLKFAYLVLSREAPPPPAADAWRVVSDVLEMKGERRVYLCAEGRWIVLAQLKRDRAPSEAVFRSLRRGDLIEVDGMERRGSLFRLGPQGTLRVRSAGALL